MVDFAWREQQHVSRFADKLFTLIFDHALAANGEVQDVTFHAKWPIDKEIEMAFGVNGGQSRHQMRIK